MIPPKCCFSRNTLFLLCFKMRKYVYAIFHGLGMDEHGIIDEDLQNKDRKDLSELI